MSPIGVLFLGLLLSASVVVWARLVGRWRSGAPILPFRPRSLHVRPPFVVVLAAAWVVVAVASHFYVDRLTLEGESTLRNVQATCLVDGLLLAVVPLLLTAPEMQPLSAFGIDLVQWRRRLVEGVTGFVAAALLVYLVLFATLPLRRAEPEHAFLRLLSEDLTLTTVAWIALAAVVLAPAAEELLFRVVLQGWLQDRLPPAAAIGVVAVLFSMVHPYPDSLAIAPLAVVLGYVYYRSYSFLSVFVVHALFNGWNVATALLARG